MAINKLSLRLHYFNRINARSFSSVSFELRFNDIDLCPFLILYIGCLARKRDTCKIETLRYKGAVIQIMAPMKEFSAGNWQL